MFDISTLAAVETTTVDILNPSTDEPLIADGKPISVTIYGPGSKPFAAAKAAASNRTMLRLKRKGKVDTTPEEDAAAQASFLTACTVSFNNFNYKSMEPGADMFRALYLDAEMGWFTEQVNKAMGDWSNFTKASETI